MVYKSIGIDIEYEYQSQIKGLLGMTKQIYKKGGFITKSHKLLNINKIIMTILRETFLYLLLEVKHFSKDRKGNQLRLQK